MMLFQKTMEMLENIKMLIWWLNGQVDMMQIFQNQIFTYTIFGKDVTIEMKRLNITFNKPIYVGFTILDLTSVTINNQNFTSRYIFVLLM